MKSIVFLTSGTRGDVQPIASLARGLQDAGHAVRVAAPPAFRELVVSQSVPFAALKGNPSDLLTGPGTQSALTFHKNPLIGVRSTWGFLRAARPLYSQMMECGWQISKDAGALVIGLPTIWGTSIAEALKIPCIGAFLQPVTPTGDFPSPVLPSVNKLGRFYNKFTYWLTSQAVFIPWRGLINHWRSKSLGLKPLPLFISRLGELDAILYGYSERVVPKPKDWGRPHIVEDKESIFVTGYWRRSPAISRLPRGLTEFIEAGDPPYYFGFGSPGLQEPGQLISLLITAAGKTGIRAVLDLPKSMKLPVHPEGTYVLNEPVPHEGLFPLLAGCIHHGGAGTTASALIAGIPSFITPLAVDQFFWGERVHALGVGPRAIPQIKLSVEKVVSALRDMKSEKMMDAARKLGDELRREDGVANAVRAMEKILAG